ncbi:MAG: zinc-binding dehydrogenase [Armatimonadetes bacterium]|nr:zinc-binding dehydrogenase [Armatimonadota bacterium]
MKAAITDGVGNVWLDEVPMPEHNAYQVLCKTLACATCTGTDQKHLHNKLPWKQTYPGILGHESIGKVVSVGSEVRNYKEGDLVLRPTCVFPGEQLSEYTSLWGGFAEYGLATDAAAMREDNPDAQPNNYARFQQVVPAELPVAPADATMLITVKECASYVSSVGVRLYSSVVILGSGSVAYSMCRFAKVFGAYPVILVGRRDEPLAYAWERIGADFTVNVQKENLLARVREFTGGLGADFMIDTTGDATFMKECLPVLSESGKAAAYATYEGPEAVTNAIPEDKLTVGTTGEDIAHQYLLDAVKLGLVNLADFYSHLLPFAQISEGFKMLKAKTAFKIVFEVMEGS